MQLSKKWASDLHGALYHDAEDEFVTLPDVATCKQLVSCHLPSLYKLLV